MMKLMELLELRRDVEGMEVPQFAEHVGISRQHYEFLRDGKRQMGAETLSAVVQAYPELSPEVAIFLRSLRNRRKQQITVEAAPASQSTDAA